MPRFCYIAIWLSLALACGSAASGQDVRAANGQLIKGQALKATDAGLEVQTQTGPRTYSWETLSAATRYRWQATYRANYDAVLGGLPPSARTNPADVETPPTAPVATTTNAAPASAPPPTATKSMLIFDQAQYENVDPISANQFPSLQLRAPNLATYLGLQYGARKSDVVYLALDTKGPEEPLDVLYVYSPSIAAYTTPLKITGFKKNVGDTRIVSFKKFKLASQFGQITTDFEVECMGAGTLSNQVTLSIAAALSKDEVKSKFQLVGQMVNLVQGDGVINVSGILDLPVLWVSLDITAGQLSLVGNLNMAHLKIVPKEGMDNRVNIVITSDKGEAVQREAVRLDEATASQKYSVVCPLKKLAAGQTYVVRASIDLGPFFGPSSFEDKITLPAIP